MATQNAIGVTIPFPVDSGGTGAATFTDHGALVGSGTGVITALAVGTDGQILVGSTGADPVFADLTSTDGTVVIAGGAGTLDLSVPRVLIVEINAQTGTTYTLILTDSAKLITLDNGSPITFTVPPNADVAFDIGTIITFTQKGVGLVTVAEGAGVTVSSRGAALGLVGQYSMATITKEDTDIWYLAGDIV